MRLYLLTRTDHVDYDEYDAKVVRARNPKHARSIACERTGDEGNIWHDKYKVTCKLLKYEGKACEVLGSFNAG